MITTTRHERGGSVSGSERDELIRHLERRAKFIRRETVRLISIAKSGHYTSVFSCAEIFAFLYDHTMRYDPAEPKWPDRDRFVMGKGHAAVGLYPLMAAVGFFPMSALDDYTRLGSAFGDHPDMRRIPGIDFSSGSLGHNLSASVGMALAARQQGRDFRVFCLLGDGELNEGQCWEAAMSAPAFGLGNLIAIVDRNQMSLDGFTEEVMPIEPLAEKWRAFNWDVREVDGHDLAALIDAFAALPEPGTTKPVALICQTVKGKGVSFMEGGREWHLGNLAGGDYDRVMAELADEYYDPFTTSFNRQSSNGRPEQSRQTSAITRPLTPITAANRTPLQHEIPRRTWVAAEQAANLRDGDSWSLITSHRLSTQAISGQVLAELAEDRVEIAVLTADLKYSNRLSDFASAWPERFYQVGIAEQNMVSIAAGMAAAGLIPYAATFAAYIALLGAEQVRTDVTYPGLPVRFLAHHAGFMLGFYGSSHHALEDLSIMRTLAGMTVICPADAPSLWAAIEATIDYPGPIYFRLGRGREPIVYETPPPFEVGKAIELRSGKDLTVIATGSMVHPSMLAADTLAVEGISVRVVDMHTVAPLDREVVIAAARETGGILTVEEHNITGGLGGAVAEVLADAGIGIRFKRHGVPDEYVPVGPPLALYAHYKLDSPGIVSVVKEWLG
jgi:transketolase